MTRLRGETGRMLEKGDNAKGFTVSVSVVGVRHTSKPLLARSVPYLQLNRRLVHGDHFVLQGYEEYLMNFL